MTTAAELEEQKKINRALLDENVALHAQLNNYVCDECFELGQEGDQSAAEAVDTWLTRAKGLGQLTAAEAAVVERLLEDLR